MATGTYPSQLIVDLVERGAIVSGSGVRPEQVQPSSWDLTLSREGYSLPGSMMPRVNERVRDLIESYARRPIDLSGPETLVRGEVYVVRLHERLRLPQAVSAYANNKSSTGRIDVQTRVLVDGTPRYDRIPKGYEGELWLEIIPKSYDITLRAGDSLNQAIFYDERHVLHAGELSTLNERARLLHTPAGEPIKRLDAGHLSSANDAVLLTLDLEQDIVGYVAKKNFRPIDLAAIGQHDPSEFFDPIPRPKEGVVFLSQGAFYIFSTYEYVSVPPDYAAEMLPYDMSAGEFRAHYAGFFDPGFGYGENGALKGTPAVLEVRPYEDDLIVRHRQPVCKMAYESLVERPDRIYGSDIRSHYAEQRGPRLSKYFVA